ncbi:xanthine dehydrogenase family protein molybdopterin-binding subunit [Pseudaquabacterium pictum]|uniref:xanthine dehydrogenase family protein molybdopterin-binding subunit n=1 Tax=Pseudaquabacterium pictum TaxID=2315236 RepID=UPI0010F9A8BC|nr:molybdopterin cofactor-binding domain-containing protein [Rubrivivax pictus]
MKRRGFLVVAGAALGTGALPGCTLPVIPKRPAPDVDAARSWVRHADGRFTLLLPRVEMGQGIGTALAAIACEELGIAPAQLTVRQPSTDDIARVRATVGSDSIKDFALPLAQACASLREALASGQARTAVAAAPQPAAALRAFQPGARWVGQGLPLAEGPAIVQGQALFVADVRRPGQLFGRVLRAPASPERPSRLRQVDEAAARAVPGCVAVVRHAALQLGQAEGIGIVARTPGALDRIATALAAQWAVDGPAFEQADLDQALDIDARLAGGGRRQHAVRRDALAPGDRWDVDLRIDIPLAAHGAIQPRAAVAEPAADGHLHLWVGSQDVFYQRDVVCRRLGLADSQVTVHGQRVGGAFGGKTLCTVELEAAVLARAVGAPVKVQWTRAQELQLGFHRPPSSHRIRLRLQGGRLQQWWHAFAGSHILFTNAAVPPWLQRATDLIGDDGVARGAALPYRMPAACTEFDLVRLPVFTGPWRGLGAGPNGFAVESAIDEAARAAGADPLAFRLQHLDGVDPAQARLARVLQRVAQAAGWGRPAAAAAPGQRSGRGLAAGIYKGSSWCAVVADVVVDAASGAIRVTRLWCAHDCGRVVHPDQVRAQCEGNLVWGLGMVLTDQLPVAGGAVDATSFAQAPLPAIGDLPPMEVVLVDHGEAPGGAGETVITAAGAAVANAVRAASGHRITRLPTARVPVAAS